MKTLEHFLNQNKKEHHIQQNSGKQGLHYDMEQVLNPLPVCILKQ